MLYLQKWMYVDSIGLTINDLCRNATQPTTGTAIALTGGIDDSMPGTAGTVPIGRHVR
jgi:hypothetical protein